MSVLRAGLRVLRRGATKVTEWGMEAVVGSMSQLSAPSAPGSPGDPRSILVLRNNDVGDVLLSTPLFLALRRRFPEAIIAAGVGDWSRDVLRGNPHVDEVLSVNAPWFNKYTPRSGAVARLRYLRSPEVDALRRRRFDLGIDVLGSAWGALLLLRAGIPWRMGVRGYAGGHRGYHQSIAFDPNEHVAASALRLAMRLGAKDLPPARPQLFLSQAERDAGESLWAGVPSSSCRIVLAPGGGLPQKCWPPSRFVELATRLSAEAAVCVVPGTREPGRSPGTTYAQGLPVWPDLGLRSLFGLVAAADLVVCNSSMPLHVAAAFSKPAVVLLGPSFPSVEAHDRQWGYPGLTHTLGRDTRGCLPSVADALEAVRQVAGRRNLAVAP